MREYISKLDNIKELVQKRTGLPKEVVDTNIEYIISRVKDHMYDEKTYTIRLGSTFGRMYANESSISRQLVRYEGKNAKKFKVVPERAKFLRRKFDYIHNSDENFFNKEGRKKSKARQDNPLFTCFKTKAQQELEQNTYCNEHNTRYGITFQGGCKE